MKSIEIRRKIEVLQKELQEAEQMEALEGTQWKWKEDVFYRHDLDTFPGLIGISDLKALKPYYRKGDIVTVKGGLYKDKTMITVSVLVLHLLEPA